MPKQSPLAKCLSTLGSLDQPELRHVRNVINDLLRIEYAEDLESLMNGPAQETKIAGHIELKMIRGYGPYKYLRVWKGKTLTSTYLGKAPS